MGEDGVYFLIATDMSVNGAIAAIVWATDHWVAALLNGVPGWEFWVLAAW
jgi:hypothetical protein